MKAFGDYESNTFYRFNFKEAGADTASLRNAIMAVLRKRGAFFLDASNESEGLAALRRLIREFPAWHKELTAVQRSRCLRNMVEHTCSAAPMPPQKLAFFPIEEPFRSHQAMRDRSQHGSKRYAWTMMVMQPAGITKSIIAEALERLSRKKKTPPLVERLRLGGYTAGLCGQILHIGPYGDPMERTFDALEKHLSNEGYTREPDSLDVYYNDARRSPPEKLRTLTRVRVWREGDAARELDDPFSP